MRDGLAGSTAATPSLRHARGPEQRLRVFEEFKRSRSVLGLWRGNEFSHWSQVPPPLTEHDPRVGFAAFEERNLIDVGVLHGS